MRDMRSSPLVWIVKGFCSGHGVSRLSDGYTYLVCTTVTTSVFVSTVLQAENVIDIATKTKQIIEY